MASPEAKAFAELLRTAPKMVDMDLAAQRAAGEHAEDAAAEPAGVGYEPVADGAVTGLWAVPPGAPADRAVLYTFGGGHVITSVAARRKFGGHLALAVGARVLVLDYPLAPEHPYPADVRAATAGYRWLLGQGWPATGVALAGESSAGGLVLCTLLALGQAGDPLPAAAFLMSPWADLTCSGASFDACRDVDLECTRESLLRMAGQYLAGHDPADPAASPVLADMSGLPPLLVQSAGTRCCSTTRLQWSGQPASPARRRRWRSGRRCSTFSSSRSASTPRRRMRSAAGAGGWRPSWAVFRCDMEADEAPSVRETGIGRLLAFSDAVFAIAFTILVLDLVVPAGLSADQLRVTLRELTPQLLSAALSFALIGRFWVAHHGIYEHVRAADPALLVLNTFLMVPIALIPFGAALLAEYPDVPIAVIIYATIVGAAAVGQLAVWLRAAQRRRLITDRVSDKVVLRRTIGMTVASVAFLISIPVALLSTTAAQLCWLLALVPTNWLATWWYGRRLRPV